MTSKKLTPLRVGGMLTLKGIGRAYLVQDFTKTTWDTHRYVRFDLRGRTLKFTVDLSGVQCLCAACLYLSLMRDPSNTTGDNYCGIQTDHGGPGGEICTEVDLMEANTKVTPTGQPSPDCFSHPLRPFRHFKRPCTLPVARHLMALAMTKAVQ